ncbi:CwfJ C-terminus 1-domain-containing protein-like protein [Limtongia smithiae]|uniref:CwfJ C-terminus 1-domain-containing protein-like protein n=1 Tax=Limtongia smithiae TaxID=1125753 RepID=UPI0034CDD814
MASKILVFGSCAGKVNAAIAKAAQINSSAAGPFEALILLGNIFPADTPDDVITGVLTGEITFALPTYFYLTADTADRIKRAAQEDANNIATNLTCAGVAGIVTTERGVKIGFASTEASAFDIEKLKAQSDVDVLVTDQWPQYITLLSNTATRNNIAEATDKTNAKATELAQRLQPRYHFSPTQSNSFWEREPFKSEGFLNREGAGGERAVRFISLANFGNAEKQKWFYAFNITVPYVPSVLPIDTTANPFIEGVKLAALQKHVTDEDLIYGSSRAVDKRKLDDSNDDKARDKFSRRDLRGGRRRGGMNTRPERYVDPSSCFFCLSNPQLAQHFIVSIGDESYITTAKGPLPMSDSKELQCPGHVLIVPFSHSATLASIEDVDSRQNTQLELAKYRKAIQSMYSKHGYMQVAFEISRLNGIHFHVQVIPVPDDKYQKVKPEFEYASEKNGYKLEVRAADDNELEQSDFFKVYLHDGSRLYVPLLPDVRFDLQFGRKVLAAVLGFPERSDWRTCVQEEKDEIRDAEQFKTIFKEFDFTMQE